jgi:hypothetical protein
VTHWLGFADRVNQNIRCGMLRVGGTARFTYTVGHVDCPVCLRTVTFETYLRRIEVKPKLLKGQQVAVRHEGRVMEGPVTRGSWLSENVFWLAVNTVDGEPVPRYELHFHVNQLAKSFVKPQPPSKMFE